MVLKYWQPPNLRFRPRKRLIAALSACALLEAVAPSILPETGGIAIAQQVSEEQRSPPDQSAIRSLGDAMGAVAFGVAWPTATFRGWLFRGWRADGDDTLLVFRLHGDGVSNTLDQSPDNIWVDLLIWVNANGVRSLKFGENNGFIPPGFTAAKAKVMFDEAANAYSASQHQPPTPPQRQLDTNSPESLPDSAHAGAEEGSSPAMPQAYLDGRRDRQKLQFWIDALPPDQHAGAEFWAGERSLPSPVACAERSEMSADWRLGCESAQAMLAQPDIRRKTEPQYRAGWNSF